MTTSQLPARMLQKEHLPFYLFVFVLFAVGIVFGAVMVGALTLEQKQELARHLHFFIQTVNEGGGFDTSASFQQSLVMHLKWVVLIWVLGLSVIGLPLVFALDFLKGVLVGFSVGYMIGQYSWKGMLFALTSVVPQNLIVIPALVITSAAAASFSVQLVRNRVVGKQGQLLPAFGSYTGIALMMTVLLTGAALYEGFLSPVVMKWVTPMLLSL
ncbi:stage II sporulation protein M [Gorillibacterium sp. sgz5001074]|uniref:stage II sporulation protein M n=1 Tax=Gorillibacterium sp. sgz5001074 TaxID=3446695 RepID=UPI003F67BFBD